MVVTALLSAGLLLWGCSPYTQQVVPFKMPATYSNMTQVAGIQIGAMAYTDPNEAQNAFGFDIRLWPVLAKRLAYERVARHSEMAEIGSGAVSHGFLGATAGALIGAAIGIVTGRGVGEAAVGGRPSPVVHQPSIQTGPIRISPMI